MAERFLRRYEVEKRTVLAKSTVYSQIKDGTITEPDEIGDLAVGWVDAEVVQWQRQLIAEVRK